MATRGCGSLSGVVPVLETPFLDDGRIDVAGFEKVLDRVLACGVGGVMFPGFASEFHKLSDDERWLLAGIVTERTKSEPDVAAVLSIPDHATYLVLRSVDRAVALGADAINILPPSFLQPPVAEIAAHLETVITHAGTVPVVVQIAPSLTGSALPVEQLLELATRSPNFRTVKVETVPPGPTVTALRQSRPHLDALVGYAGMHLIDALRRGAVGVQPGCAFIEIYVAIWDAWVGDDEERAIDLHRRLLPYISYWMQSLELLVQVEKTISMRRGWIATDACRRPGRTLDHEEVATIDRFLTEFASFLPPG